VREIIDLLNLKYYFILVVYGVLKKERDIIEEEIKIKVGRIYDSQKHKNLDNDFRQNSNDELQRIQYFGEDLTCECIFTYLDETPLGN
jgi:hypothetical protein